MYCVQVVVHLLFLELGWQQEYIRSSNLLEVRTNASNICELPQNMIAVIFVVKETESNSVNGLIVCLVLSEFKPLLEPNSHLVNEKNR